MTVPVTQKFIPGPRLIDGTDLNTLVDQVNSELIGPLVQTTTETSLKTLSVSGLTGAQLCSVTLAANTSLAVFPTASDLIGALPNARVGQTYQIQLRNASAATTQLSGLTGTILAGTSPTLIQTLTARFYAVQVMSLPSAPLTGTIQLTGFASTTL